MTKAFIFVSNIFLLSSLCYADMTVGIRGSVGRVLKEIQPASTFVGLAIGKFIQNTFLNSEKAEEEREKREQALRISVPGKCDIETFEERNQKIKDLRNRILEALKTVQSTSEQSLQEMEAELFELVNEPTTIEFQKKEKIARIDIGPNQFQPEPARSFCNQFVPGILNAPVTPVENRLPEFPDDSVVTPVGSQSSETSGDSQKIAWGERATGWNDFVGYDGSRDPNRLYLTDPVVKRWLGSVAGRTVADIGSGNGYWTRKLRESGANVFGIEPQSEMLEVSRAIPCASGIGDPDYRQDSASRLETVGDQTCDFALMNFVLMDCKHYEKCLKQANRILKPGGKLVIVMVHPGFPKAYRQEAGDGSTIFEWREPYVLEHRQATEVTRLSGPPVIVFHRPLGAYFKAFIEAGFFVEQLVEPISGPELSGSLTPQSIAFLLRKPKVESQNRCFQAVSSKFCDLSNCSGDAEKTCVEINKMCFYYVAEGAFEIKIDHPFFSSGILRNRTCKWTSSYFKSVTLSKYFQLFKQDGCEVLGLIEEGDSESLPTTMVFRLFKPRQALRSPRLLSARLSLGTNRPVGYTPVTSLETPPLPEGLPVFPPVLRPSKSGDKSPMGSIQEELLGYKTEKSN